MIELSNVSKKFISGANQLTALKDATASFAANKVTAIVGPSGSGKSTLLRLLSGLEQPSNGTITINGTTVSDDKKALALIHSQVGMVFQQYYLFPDKTVMENVTLALKLVKKLKQPQAEAVALEQLQLLGIADKVNYYPHQLSGGQQQRVAIARALALKPKILLFDEPTAALDPEMTSNFGQILQTLVTEGLTIIMVTHDMSLARAAAQKVIFIENGEILLDTCTTKFFIDPNNARAQQFINSENKSSFTNNELQSQTDIAAVSC